MTESGEVDRADLEEILPHVLLERYVYMYMYSVHMYMYSVQYCAQKTCEVFMNTSRRLV